MITAAQVKELRQITGIGMMECKKALQENGGDKEKAIRWLRERGMARAAKKSTRTAAEGTVEIYVSPDSKKALVIELNCETDFAAQNQSFRAFAQDLAAFAINEGVLTVEELLESELNGEKVSATITNLVSKIGENIKIRRLEALKAGDQEFIASYKHMGGKISTLVMLKGEQNTETEKLANDVAMHITAASPRFVDRSEVSTGELDQEKDLARKKLEKEGKPSEIIEKILVGQMNKFYSEACLVDQPFVKEPKLSVAKFLKQASPNLSPVKFIRFQLGEGIEVEKSNFRDEVAEQLKA